MPLITVPQPIQMTRMNQAAEDILAATLTGLPDGSSTIWNDDIEGGRIRRWNGTAFETVEPIPTTILSNPTIISETEPSDPQENTIWFKPTV